MKIKTTLIYEENINGKTQIYFNVQIKKKEFICKFSFSEKYWNSIILNKDYKFIKKINSPFNIERDEFVFIFNLTLANLLNI